MCEFVNRGSPDPFSDCIDDLPPRGAAGVYSIALCARIANATEPDPPSGPNTRDSPANENGYVVPIARGGQRRADHSNTPERAAPLRDVDLQVQRKRVAPRRATSFQST